MLKLLFLLPFVLSSPAFIGFDLDFLPQCFYWDDSISTEVEGLWNADIPDDIKSSVPLPEWLISWEDAEFVMASPKKGIPLGGDHENITIRAAAYLVSMTGGAWLDNIQQDKKLNDFYLTAFEKYLATGNEDVAMEIHLYYRSQKENIARDL